MSKPLTSWTTNPSKYVDAVPYSSASVTYSSAGTDYSTSTAALDELNKPATLWTAVAKTASAWVFNTNYATNAYAYDGTNAYDSGVQTYDGVNGTQQSTNVKVPTSWSQI